MRNRFVARPLQSAFLAVSIAAGVAAPLLHSRVQASPVYSGQVCSENVGRLTNEITWSRDLDKVQQEAASQDKLILWVHMVGKLDGFT
ncbi:hypothetical protein KF728_14430 [Candidatus Obscuribacterales bacterium]|nr:hypothetical protein [Candidatus Obscuribacterales bacterium]MBX3151345.1 hypothetical protein [Candidatus Obscuribacterales bacterium]